MEYFVYILSNQTNVAIYTGITNNLERRLWEHENHADPGSFTARYKINKLVYFETTPNVKAAMAMEDNTAAPSYPEQRRI